MAERMAPPHVWDLVGVGGRLRSSRGWQDGKRPLSTTIYGIKNCDTVRKARSWLEAHDHPYAFHDYKSAGIDRERLARWCAELGWEKLFNRSGTTFRKLADADKQDLDEERAIALMLAQPAMIRRPVLDLGDWRLVGFAPAAYEEAFAGR